MKLLSIKWITAKKRILIVKKRYRPVVDLHGNISPHPVEPMSLLSIGFEKFDDIFDWHFFPEEGCLQPPSDIPGPNPVQICAGHYAAEYHYIRLKIRLNLLSNTWTVIILIEISLNFKS